MGPQSPHFYCYLYCFVKNKSNIDLDISSKSPLSSSTPAFDEGSVVFTNTNLIHNVGL